MTRKTNLPHPINDTPAAICRQQQRFFEAFIEKGTVSAALVAANATRADLKAWKQDPDFQTALKEAEETAVDNLEALAIERAKSGKSDTLLMFLLNGNRPEKYRPAAAAVNVNAVTVSVEYTQDWRNAGNERQREAIDG